MIQYTDVVIDELSQSPIEGAEVFVYNTPDNDGDPASLATLYASDGVTPVVQPLKTNNLGVYSFYQNAGEFTGDVYVGARLRYRSRLFVGGGYSGAAQAAAEAAKAAGGVGEFANTAAGLAGTEIGQTFWVDNGDGTGTTYRHDAGPVATEIGKFIKDPTDSGAANLLAGGVPTTAALASSSGGGMVGLPDAGNVEQGIPYYTPERFGAVSGDSGTASNFLSFLEACRDNGIAGRLKKGATYYLAPNVFTLGDGESLDLECEGVAASTILPSSSANTYLFTCSDAAKLSIKGIRLGNATSTRLINMASSASSSNEWELELDRCVIDISGNTSRSAIVAYGYRRKVTITNCDFYGSLLATTGVSDYSGQVLLDMGGAEDISDEAVTTVRDCRFFGGSLAFNLAGTNLPGPLTYVNNRHYNQTISGTRLYHGAMVYLDGLYYEGIGGANTAAGSLQGRAIWIDTYAPLANKNHNRFGSITVRNSSGIGILMEECQGGSYGPWVVDGMASVGGHSGVGGMALLVGGLCTDAKITITATDCAAPIRVNGSLTAVTGSPRNISFVNCTIFGNATGGVLVDGATIGISFLGGAYYANSSASSGTYDDILFSTSAPISVNVSNIRFHDSVITTDSACCVRATVSSGVYTIVGNYLHSAGSYVVNLTTATGVAMGNYVQTLGKQIFSTGSNFRITGNARYRTEYNAVISTTGGAVYTLTKATMALGTGTASAQRVQATYMGTNTGYKVAANLNSGDVDIRLTDASGTLVAGDVCVSAYTADAWR